MATQSGAVNNGNQTNAMRGTYKRNRKSINGINNRQRANERGQNVTNGNSNGRKTGAAT